jgi:ComF family protein
MKYQGEYARAEWHGQQIAELAIVLGWQADVLIPVPLHRRRMKRRGFNQSRKVALAAGSQLLIEVCDGLRRDRDTPSQTSLDRRQRQANVVGAFSSTKPLAGHRIILVDDVTTTCSTLLECARVCADSGAASVRALTIATEV